MTLFIPSAEKRARSYFLLELDHFDKNKNDSYLKTKIWSILKYQDRLDIRCKACNTITKVDYLQWLKNLLFMRIGTKCVVLFCSEECRNNYAAIPTDLESLPAKVLEHM